MTDDRRLEHDWFPMRVPENVEIGEGSFLHSSFAFMRYRSERACGVRIGRHSSVYQATMFELGPEGQVEVGDYCMLWGNIFSANSRIVVGSHCLISGECYLSDTPTPIPTTDMDYRPEPPGEDPSVIIGDNCWIGIRSALLKGARLGEGVIVGAGTVVDFEVPPFSIVAGNPAGIVGSAKPRA